MLFHSLTSGTHIKKIDLTAVTVLPCDGKAQVGVKTDRLGLQQYPGDEASRSASIATAVAKA